MPRRISSELLLVVSSERIGYEGQEGLRFAKGIDLIPAQHRNQPFKLADDEQGPDTARLLKQRHLTSRLCGSDLLATILTEGADGILSKT